MGGYIVLPIVRDPSEAVQESYAVMQTWFPGWQPDPKGADPMTALLNAAAVLYTDLATLATSMGEEAFRYEGRTLDQLLPIDAKSASASVTLTAVDDSGWEVPEGIEVAGIGPTGEPVVFALTDVAEIPSGSVSVSGVPVTATIDGIAGNDVSGTGDFVQYLDFLVSVVFDGPSTDGQDRETDSAYLDRLREQKQLDSPEPIRFNDFAVLGRSLAGTTIRATAIDGLDPTASGGAGSLGHLATVSVALVDAATGDLVDSDVRNAVAAGLDAEREEGFQVFAIDPTISGVDVSLSAHPRPGWDGPTMVDQIETAIAAFLNPATWGALDDTGQGLTWENTDTVRAYALAERILRCEAVGYIEPGTLLLALHGDTLAADDLLLPGWAPLPTTTGATISVTAL